MLVHYSINVDSVQGTEGEAVLMRKDSSSGEYLQVDGESASIKYAGDWTGAWKVPNDTETEPLAAVIPFAEGHQGSIERLKVRFNYSNANGDGYIDSDELVLCRGTYVGFDGSSSGVSGFSGVFAIDKEILPDPSKLTVVSATIDINGTTRQLETFLDIEEGVLLAGAEYASILDSDETITSMGPVKVTLNYNDGDADWTVTAEGEIDRTPGVDIWQALVGSTLNGPGGLRSALIDYSINDNGSAVKSSSVTLKQGEHTKTWTDTEGNLDVTINDSIALDDDYLFYPSVGMEIEVAVTYVLDGAEQTKTETYTDIQQCDCYLETKITSMQNIDGDMELINGTITLKSLNGDPCSYTATLEEAASILWLPAEPYATPTLISGYRFTLDKTTLSVGESASFEAIDWPPSTSDGSFEMTVDAEATGTMGGVAYEYVGGLQARIALDASAVNVFGDGSFSYSPDTYLGGSIELLNGVNSDQLTDLSFTILKDGAETTEFSAVGHIIPAAGAAADWVGFEFVSSHGDTVPTLDASAEYEVFATAIYDGNSVGSDIFPIDVPPPTSDYLRPGTAHDFEESLYITPAGFVADFPLDESIVNDPEEYGSDETLVPVSITLLLPDGSTRNLLGAEGCSYYFSIDDEEAPIFCVRYDADGDLELPAGAHTLTVTLRYDRGSEVENLRSTNSADFTVTAPSDPLVVDAYFRKNGGEEYDVFDLTSGLPSTLVIQAQIWADVEGVDGSNCDDAVLNVTDVQIAWTIDGTEQDPVSVAASASGLSYDTDYFCFTGTVSGSVSVPPGATHASLLCRVSAEFNGLTGFDIAESNRAELTNDSASITMSVSVLGGQGTATSDGFLQVSGTVVYDFTPSDAYTAADVMPSSVFVYWYDSDQNPSTKEYTVVEVDSWPDPDTSVSGRFTFSYGFETDDPVPDDASYFKIRVYDDSSIDIPFAESDYALIT